MPAVSADTLKVVGVLGDRLVAALPGTATFAEQGLRGFELPVFLAAYLPGGAARPVVERL